MPKKALVVVPTFTGVQPRPFRGLLEIAYVAGRMCPDWKFGFLAPERQSLVRAMTTVGQTVLDQGFDCAITFDDDCFPPYDCIPRLLAHRAAGRTFVAGVGVMKGFPHTTTVGAVYPEGYSLLQRPEGPATVSAHEWLDDVDRLPPLASVDFCGVPVALIGREAFAQCAKPWFALHGEDGGQITHDVFFCRRLKAAGFDVLVDTTIRCGHLTDAPVITFENRSQARVLTEAGVA